MTASGNQGGPSDPPPPYPGTAAGSSSSPKKTTGEPWPKEDRCPQETPASPPPPPQSAIISPQPVHLPPRQFPPEFNIYAIPGSRSYNLGLHQDQPLYTVGFHSGWSGLPDVVLHSGPSPTHPIMAGSTREMWSPSTWTITLPPLPGSAQDSSQLSMTRHSGFASATWSFSVETGYPGQVESFEWRRTRGIVLQDLQAGSTCWKLIRMSRAPPQGAPPGTVYVAGPLATSDGFEVVAASGVRGFGLSMYKIAKFKFYGTGASGMLGERWALMAVITAMSIKDYERKQG